MNLKLHVTKNYNVKDYNNSDHIRIAVIDLDISEHYPANFVCILPRAINPNSKTPNKFQVKFGDQSQKVIKELLIQELKTSDDQVVKKELLARLKLVDPKPKNLVKCNVCGEEFKSKKYRYGKQKTCYECRAKRYKNKVE